VRAIRVYPHEITPGNVNQILERLHNLGITDILYEAKNVDGKVFYSSKLAEVVDDRLGLICESAKEYKMRVSVWFCTFPEGYRGRLFGSGISRFLRRNPDCTAVDNKGYNTLERPVPCDYGLENYTCPANPKVQNYELGLIKEIVKSYPVNGIHLDFIRYPIPGDYCYCDYCTTHFKDTFGISIKDEEAPRYLLKWRQQMITDFVNKVYDELKSYDKNLLLSALVWKYDDCLKFTQDWKRWKVDFISPMFHHKGLFKRSIWVRDEVHKNRMISNKTMVASIGGLYSDLFTKKEWELCEKYALEGGAEGILYEHYGLPEVVSTLENSRMSDIKKIMRWNLFWIRHSIRVRILKPRRSSR